jgi:hypothetical protein
VSIIYNVNVKYEGRTLVNVNKYKPIAISS